MDIATIVGFIAFATALMFGIGSHLELVIETPMLIMVFGGGLALTLIALSLQHVVGLAGVVARTLFTRVTVPTLLGSTPTPSGWPSSASIHRLPQHLQPRRPYKGSSPGRQAFTTPTPPRPPQ